MARLNEAQKQSFWRDGYLLVENAVDPETLQDLRHAFDAWVAESKSHSQAWGKTVDGRPRFDVEQGHCAEKPALRRVNSPVEISAAYDKAMRGSAMTEIVGELIGPNVKYHHSKINSKLPGAATEVKWHQDFPFTPHSNDDLVTALLFIDEVTAQNGPLEIVPGTHRGEIYGLWRGDSFAASVREDVAAESQGKAVRCTGPAGACCFMHTRLLHGSSANRSSRPRTLSITVYAAEDAIALSPNPVPSKLDGLVVCGKSTGKVRTIAFEIKLPKLPKSASFFDQQTQ